MEIRDLVNQYYNNGVSSNASPAQTQGVEQLTQALAALKEGAIFEGTVNNIRGSQVLLGLSSGQNITARLLSDIGLTEGESVFFQVKKHEGSEIVIKPVSIGASSGNPIIENALKSASLPVTKQTLAMVDEMIKNKMPIDAKSIADMGREVLLNPTADPKLAVVLKSLGIPVNSDTITQINNYSRASEFVFTDLGELSDGFISVIEQDPETFDDVTDIINQVFLDGDDAISDSAFEPAADTAPLGSAQASESASSRAAASTSAAMPDTKGAIGVYAAVNGQEQLLSDEMPGAAASKPKQPELPPDTAVNREDFPKGAIGNTLDRKDFQKVSDFVNRVPAFRENFPGLFDAKGRLRPDVSSKDVFLAMKALFDTRGGEFTKKTVKSSGFPELIKGMAEEKYLLTPEETVHKEKINDSFTKIQQDMDKVSQQAAEKLPDQAATKLQSLSRQVSSNVSFIREVNTVYSYIQIPLKLSNQNATGELYVYADRKKKHWDPDEPLTAFLHFDLENLGSTDISLRMQRKKLDTKFSLADNVSYALIEANIHLLQKKLESMGYDCSVSVTSNDVKRNFVDDFLKQDSKKRVAQGGKQILRYSFDVRA